MAETNISTCKRCMKCKVEKPLSDFNKNKSKKDGHGTECRACANAYSKAYHASHLEEHKARLKAYKAKYPERIKEWNRQCYLRSDKEAENARRRLSYQKHKEKRLAHSRKMWYVQHEYNLERKRIYRKKTPELQLVYVRSRQTRQKNAMPGWADLEAIKAIYRQSAWVSRITGVKHHVDHYYPLKSDIVCGLHVAENLRIIPATENLSKGNNFPDEGIP